MKDEKEIIEMLDINDFKFSKEIEEFLRKREEYKEKTKDVSVGEY